MGKTKSSNSNIRFFLICPLHKPAIGIFCPCIAQGCQIAYCCNNHYSKNNCNKPYLIFLHNNPPFRRLWPAAQKVMKNAAFAFFLCEIVMIIGQCILLSYNHFSHYIPPFLAGGQISALRKIYLIN